MQLRAFPPLTRQTLAALDLAYETGQITPEEHATQELAVIADARTQLGLDDSWKTDPTPPQPHQPNGYTCVFWKP